MANILERYRQLHPRSEALYREARELFPDGVTHDTRYVMPFPIYCTHAEGARKWDVDGLEYIDYVMGHGALLLGHTHPDVVAAVNKQMARGTHLGASHELELQWAQWVKKLIPSAEKVRFTSSGTEAAMIAVRLARAYTGRSKVIKFQDHFHGWNDYLLAGSDRGTGGIPRTVWNTMIVLPPNNLAGVEKALTEDKDVAAVILEPTGAHMGLTPVYPSFLHSLRDVTLRHNVLLIFDEVVTGFRISPGGAQARYGVTPDLTALAKILGGGLPGGAVAGRADIMDMIAHKEDPQWDNTRRISHPGTFNANPLSAAAGCKALELVATGAPTAQAERAAQSLRDGLNRLLHSLEIPGCARGVASVFHLSLGRPCRCDEPSVCQQSPQDIKAGMPPGLAGHMKRSLLNSGVDLMASSGITGLVSAVHGEKEIQQTLRAFEEALTSLRHEGLV
ncbi:MAG: aspartate aminotransferase family protein [Chloroflexi bacterium]|nr:aspartate aminotransferase family protein [Chloroflexota bacterium]